VPKSRPSFTACKWIVLLVRDHGHQGAGGADDRVVGGDQDRLDRGEMEPDFAEHAGEKAGRHVGDLHLDLERAGGRHPGRRP